MLSDVIFFKILLTHEGSHREAYRDFQPSLTSSAGGAKVSDAVPLAPRGWDIGPTRDHIVRSTGISNPA